MEERNNFIENRNNKKRYSQNYPKHETQKKKISYFIKSKLLSTSTKLLNKIHTLKTKENHDNIYKFKTGVLKKNKKKLIIEFSFSCFYKSFLIFILILILLFAVLLLLNHSQKENDINIPNDLNIKIAFYYVSIRYGGVQRVIATLINFLSREKYFTIYLITNRGRLQDEYPIPNTTKRIILPEKRINVFEAVESENIDILIFNFYCTFYPQEIGKLNKLNKTKVIYYLHSSFLFFVYNNKYNIKSTIYSALINSKYVFSLIPVENDYLFKKWGINNSILIDNPSSIEYDLVTPSDLSEKNIVLIGRGFDTKKRYDLSIKAMVNIIKEVPDCKMNIISGKYNNLDHLIRNLSLENYVSFTGFHNTIEKYLKKASLHILSSLSESYSLALSETKIYGIPSIICGLDYLALSRGGTVIIYDDNPDTIAKEAIKILKDDKYRKKLGKEARESMIKHKNDLILKKWVKVLLAIYKGDDISYKKYADNTLTEEEAKTIIHNQLQIFRKRKLRFSGLSFEKFESYSF